MRSNPWMHLCSSYLEETLCLVHVVWIALDPTFCQVGNGSVIGGASETHGAVQQVWVQANLRCTRVQ